MRELVPYFGIFALLLFGAGSFFGVFAIRREMRRNIRHRAKLLSPARPPWLRSENDEEDLALPVVIGFRIRSFFSAGLARRWGMTTHGGVLIAVSIISVAVAWMFLSALLHLPIYIVVPGLVAAFYFGPRQLLKNRQRQVEDTFTDLFPEAVDMITRIVRAGLPINVAIRAVGNEAPPPVNQVFSTLAAEEKIGVRFDEALAAAADRIGLPDFRFFAVAVALHYSTGGNIAATLEILSDIVRKRKATRMKAKATTAEVRTSAIVLGSLPFVVIGGLLVLSPQYLAPLSTDPRGNVIIGLAVGFLAAAYFSMRWMMQRATRI